MERGNLTQSGRMQGARPFAKAIHGIHPADQLKLSRFAPGESVVTFGATAKSDPP
jgi:hypothetical protein